MRRAIVLSALVALTTTGCVSKLAYGRVKTALTDAGLSDANAACMADKGVRKAALLGTRNVMVESFYRQKLIAHDIELLPPEMAFVDTLDRIIYDELIQGKVTRQAERELKTIITNLEQDGAEAVVLGCTELDMVVDVDANVLPIFDCTRIHAEAAVEWILG